MESSSSQIWCASSTGRDTGPARKARSFYKYGWIPAEGMLGLDLWAKSRPCHLYPETQGISCKSSSPKMTRSGSAGAFGSKCFGEKYALAIAVGTIAVPITVATRNEYWA